MAGKTGTCQVDYTSGNVQYISSFVGYFPVEKPKYSCIVVIHKPNKSKGYYGATVAAPVFKKIAKKIFNNIPYEITLNPKALSSLDQKKDPNDDQNIQWRKAIETTNFSKTQPDEIVEYKEVVTLGSSENKSQKTELE